MELAQAIFRYLNRVICSDELLEVLYNYDHSKLTVEAKEMMFKLISDIKEVKKTTPNETDEIEETRKNTLQLMMKCLKSNENNLSTEKEYNELLEELNKKREGGKLYEKIVELIHNNVLIKILINFIDDKELLETITEPFFCFHPLKISSIKFCDLINLAIKTENKEALLIMGFDYSEKHDINIIWDYFIENKETDYLIRLLSSLDFSVNFKKVLAKINFSNDEQFIEDFFKGLDKKIKVFVCE